MMRVSIHTRSDAVHRTLSALLEAAGHEPADVADADCLLVDAAHASAKSVKADMPTLILGGTSEGALATPVRVASVLQALQRISVPPLALGAGWQLDPVARSLSHAAHASVSLTEKEAALLHALAVAGASGAARETLLSDIWGMQADTDTHTLETHIYRLRAKLNGLTPCPGELATEGGTYRLVAA